MCSESDAMLCICFFVSLSNLTYPLTTGRFEPFLCFSFRSFEFIIESPQSSVVMAERTSSSLSQQQQMLTR